MKTEIMNSETSIEIIRRAVDAKGNLPAAAASLSAEADLYAAGLSPFCAVQVMLWLEATLDVEFPKPMLERRSMATMATIAALIGDLLEAEARPRAA
ncbi:acyl carrier protein [Methylosinus sporium]|uniref:Acyl carrier protein n=1 Tax=Methylosinus sporium TaxID=428 RepID=A0A549SQV5_METSR|nr:MULTISPECIES: acyl carrier protein [Methylosinus]MBU3890564.1 acyl carrier protein [Methylosinus sp. KRF6]TRL32003.1 acyl carrier protein [Methylosinus sporium]